MFLYGGKATGKMPAGNYAVYNLTVSGNTIITTGGGITGTDLQNCTLAGNRITHTGAAAETTVGILLHGSSGNLIEKNTCTALHNGLKCMDASHSNELRSNTVTNSRSSAICIVDSNGVEVTENSIRTGATNGIFVQRSKRRACCAIPFRQWVITAFAWRRRALPPPAAIGSAAAVAMG